jgi:chromate reductase
MTGEREARLAVLEPPPTRPWGGSAAPAMRILAISGSLRRESHNRGLLLAAAELLPQEVELELFEQLKALPPYDQDDDLEPAPAAVARLRAAIADADALLIATPEYNSSIPGQLKNALDWASRPLATSVLRNKPAAVIGASIGAFGAVWSQAELRKVLAATGARVLDVELAVGHAAERFDERGRFTDPQLREQLGGVVEVLLDEVGLRGALAGSTMRTPLHL